MPPDDNHNEETSQNEKAVPSSARIQRDFFATPATIKHIFAKFPVVTYLPNQLPIKAPGQKHIPTLYVFSTPEDATRNAPSYNPSCLKWQAYLKFLAIEFISVSSNNHASPAGALPFLLPAINASKNAPAIRSSALQKWALDQTQTPRTAPSQPQSQIQAAYLSLLDGPIRLAYLHTLYLTPNVFKDLAEPCYINSSSYNQLVRLSLSHSLIDAAETEIVTSCKTPRIDVEALYRDAEDAFEAFSVFLGTNEWFEVSIREDNAQSLPGLLDSAVFAYTYFCLLPAIADGKLGAAVKRCGNLVHHHTKIIERYF